MRWNGLEIYLLYSADKAGHRFFSQRDIKGTEKYLWR